MAVITPEIAITYELDEEERLIVEQILEEWKKENDIIKRSQMAIKKTRNRSLDSRRKICKIVCKLSIYL